MESRFRDGIAVRTSSLGKRYANGSWGLRDADLQLPVGRMVAVLGPNGAGKSTLLHMLAGAIQPSEGSVTIADTSLRVGWSSQRTTIDWYLNVRQNVDLGGRLYGLSRRESRQRADDMLQRFHLSASATDDVSMLSGGQQQRIQIARTLISEPDIMLLDEPTAALDVESSEAVLGYIRDRTRQGALALVSSHDLGLLERYCDDVLFVLNQRVHAHEPMDAFLQRFAPRTSVALTLDVNASDRVIAALEEYSPETDQEHSQRVNVNLASHQTLTDVIVALLPVARVVEASRPTSSLRTVYLQLTKTEEAR